MAELHPLDMVSVTLNQSRPRPKFQNKDVAFIPVTRFNLRMNMSRSERFGHLGTRNLYESPEYDAYWRPRAAIFERVCLPSVLNMVPRPHAWYIAFGEMRPPYIRDLIERLSEYPWIVPYLRTGTLTEIDDPLPAMLTEHLQRLGIAVRLPDLVLGLRADLRDLRQSQLPQHPVLIAQVRVIFHDKQCAHQSSDESVILQRAGGQRT